MIKLITELKTTQATLMAFMVKTWGFHWNVTGRNFSEYHEFFGTIYNDAFANIDIVSEHLRQCDAMAPAAFSKFMEVSKIDDSVVPMEANEMIRQTTADNAKVLDALNTARDVADDLGKRGIVNDLEGMIAAHEKLAWMLRSYQ